MDQNLKARLLSGDMETQLLAVDESLKMVREIVDTALRALLTCPHPGPLSYHLEKFGPFILEGLEPLFQETPDGEARVCMALMLLNYGSKSGVELLIGEVRAGASLSYAAADLLAKAGIHESGPVIVDQLRRLAETSRFDPAKSGSFNTLCLAIRTLGIAMPDDIRGMLLEDGVDIITCSWAEQALQAKGKGD